MTASASASLAPGAGGRGSYHARNIVKWDLADVVATCDVYRTRAEQAAAKAGATADVCQDHRRVIDRGDIDAVVVAVTDHWHTPITLDALDAGKDVFLEKPMTFRMEEGHQIVKAVKRSKRVVQVGTQQKSGPHFIEAKQRFIDSGEIGKVSLVRTWWIANRGYLRTPPPNFRHDPDELDWNRFLGSAPKRPFDAQRYFGWYSYADYSTGQPGGVLVHTADVVHWYLGLTKPAAVVAAGFFAALVAALWAYQGWADVSQAAAEVRQPQRNLPRVLIGGTVVIMGVYLLTNLAYFYVLPPADVAASDRVAATMMERISGNFGAGAVSVAAMISIFAALNGGLLTSARVPYAAARDGLFFRSFGFVHPAHRTPSVSLLAVSIWSALLVLSGRYEQLFTYVIFASWLLYGMAAAAVLVLRRRQPHLPRPYRTLGYPVVPVLFVLVAACMLVSTLLVSPRESLMGLGIAVAGIPFYFYWKRRAPGPTPRSE